ncbi:MAG: AraC family transcriptional regulator [Bacteroidota bacterium]
MKEQNVGFLSPYLELNRCSQRHGLHSKEYRFLPRFGKGTYEWHSFDGLVIKVLDSAIHQNIVNRGASANAILDLSFLLNGTRIIQIEDLSKDLVFESQESYLMYLSGFKRSISYLKERPIKEVKILMSEAFMKKHRLSELGPLSEKYGIENLENHFARPFCPKTSNILAEIVDDKRSGFQKRLFLESKVLELLMLAISQEQRKHPARFSTSSASTRKIYEIRILVSKDLKKSYTIPQLSKISGLNDFYIKNEFKKVFGESLSRYVMRIRMEKARKLLSSTEQSIYLIAEQVGYKNATHFSAAFKRMTGITPLSYRKNFRSIHVVL